MSNRKGEWLRVDGENFFSLLPQYYCSNCNHIISGYYPPNECERCSSINEYKGNSISLSMRYGGVSVSLTHEELEMILTGIDVGQFECQLPETDKNETIRNLIVKLECAKNQASEWKE